MTGRNVLAFHSQAHVEPDPTVEIFFLDEPLEGFAGLEIDAHGERVPLSLDTGRVCQAVEP